MVGGVGVVVGDQKIVVFFQITYIQLISVHDIFIPRHYFVGDGGAVQVVPPCVADDEPGPGGVLFLGSVLVPGRPVPSRFIPILELEVDFPIFHQIAQLAGHLIVVVSPIAGTEPKGSQDGVGDAVQLLEGAPAQAKLKGDRVLQDIIPATSAIYRGVFPQVLLRDLRQHIVTHRGRRDGPGDGQGGFHRLQGRVPVLIFFPARLLCDDISLFIHFVGEAGKSALPIVHRPDARAGLRDHGGGPRAQAQAVQKQLIRRPIVAGICICFSGNLHSQRGGPIGRFSPADRGPAFGLVVVIHPVDCPAGLLLPVCGKGHKGRQEQA